jgi:hypothetical protein
VRVARTAAVPDWSSIKRAFEACCGLLFRRSVLQMEFQRRVGAGTLAEVLGNDTLYIDLAIRTLDMYGAAERAYNTSDNYTQFAVLAYCDVRRFPLPLPCFYDLAVETTNDYCRGDAPAGNQRVLGQQTKFAHGICTVRLFPEALDVCPPRVVVTVVCGPECMRPLCSGPLTCSFG